MTISLSAVTGTAQTGLTSPTYTPVADTAPDSNGKQYAFTTLGGTQAGVVAHSASGPFTITFVRPKQLKAIKFDVGGYSNIARGRNVWTVLLRKGVNARTNPANADNMTDLFTIRLAIEVPVGAEVNDPESLRAGLSAFIGALSQQSSGLGDSIVSGIF